MNPKIGKERGQKPQMDIKAILLHVCGIREIQIITNTEANLYVRISVVLRMIAYASVEHYQVTQNVLGSGWFRAHG